MRKIASFLIIFTTIFNIFGAFSFAKTYASGDTYFVVTAYYSPLPNQQYYIKGSFEADKRLNGNGTHGASGRPVFEGMLAAPKNYKFGTAIYLEGVGTGIVADRGGAIVNAGVRGHSYDRIDIWMGYGDTGLKRAVAWGKRTVKGQILGIQKGNGNLDIDKFAAPSSVNHRLKKSTGIYSKGIGVGSSNNDIKKLQEELIKKGIYSGKIDGKYNEKLINELFSFQVKNGIMKSEYDYGAGYWGAKTRSLVSKLPNKNGNNSEIVIAIDKPNNPMEGVFNSTIGPYSDEEDVKTLQNLFSVMGEYEGEITGEYRDIMPSLLEYQLEKKIIISRRESGAGYFGPKTRKMAQADYKVALALNEQREQEALILKEAEEKLQKQRDEVIAATEKKIDKYIDGIGNPRYGQVSPSVRELQKVLIAMGYLKTKDTAIFGTKTKQALLSFQLDNNIVSNNNTPGAGIYGPKTKQTLRDLLLEKSIERELASRNLVAINNNSES
ncbi:MAG: peptidoglycan-binding protein [Candidatus Gracilibacteria bacterium]|nr:peptidoglycan-binding protein [Candidatus Gracilibacteria bacterium]